MGAPIEPLRLSGSLRCLYNEWWAKARWVERWDTWYYRAQRRRTKVSLKCPRYLNETTCCYACPNRQESLPLDSYYDVGGHEQ